jgi:hypothetical protein
MVEIADGSNSTIYRTDPTGAEMAVLAADASVPQWSAQGQYIVYQSREVVAGDTWTWLHIVDAETEETISQISGGNIVRLRWAEDDSLLGVIHVQHPGAERLAVFDPDDRTLQYLPGSGIFIFSFTYWE